MENVDQSVNGIGNTVNANFYEYPKTVDILPNELESFLDYFNSEMNEKDDIISINKFELDKKNELNGIDKENFSFIKEDFSSFQDIDDALRRNKDGTIKKKYKNATRILNMSYKAKFQKQFPIFVLEVAKKYREDKKSSDEQFIKITKLLHYMYCQCDIGIKP